MLSVVLLTAAGCWGSRTQAPAAPTPTPAPAGQAAPDAETRYKYCRPWGLSAREPPTDLPDPNAEWTFGTIEAGDLGCYVSMCAEDRKLYTFQGDYAICDARDALGDWLGYQVQARFERSKEVPASIRVTQLRRVGQTDWQPKE